MTQKRDGDWDDAAATWDAREDVRWFAERANESLARRVGPHLGRWDRVRALDFGCGTGLLTEHLGAKCREVVAVDASPAMVEVLRAKLKAHELRNVEAVRGDLETLDQHPSLREPFDLIVASSVCAFQPDYPGVVRALARRLATGGYFVQWDWQRAEDGTGFGLTRSQVATAFDEAGLETVHIGVAFELVTEGQRETVLIGVARRLH